MSRFVVLLVLCACSRDHQPTSPSLAPAPTRAMKLDDRLASIDGGPKVRETITKRGERAFGAVWESNTDGTWSAYSVEHLTR